MMVPLGAVPGFNMRHEMYVVAGHYGVAWGELKQKQPKVERVRLARDALFWRLTHHRKFSPARVGQMLGTSQRTARRAAQRHAAEIAEFNASIKERA